MISQIIQQPTKTVTGCSADAKQQRKIHFTCHMTKGIIIASTYSAHATDLEKKNTITVKYQPPIVLLIIEVMRLNFVHCGVRFFSYPFFQFRVSLYGTCAGWEPRVHECGC